MSVTADAASVVGLRVWDSVGDDDVGSDTKNIMRIN